MTKAGSLSPDLQSVTEDPALVSTLGALQGVPAEGVGRDEGSAAGEGIPAKPRADCAGGGALGPRLLRPLKSALSNGCEDLVIDVPTFS